MPVSAQPMPAEHEMFSGDSMTVDAVIYDIVLAEVKRGETGRRIIRLIPQNERWLQRWKQRTSAKIHRSSDAPKVAHLAFTALENKNRLSVITQPRVVTTIGTKATIVSSCYEMELLPIRHEGGIIYSDIVVNRKDFHDGWEQQGIGLINNSPLLIHGEYGGRDYVYFVMVTAQQLQLPQEAAQAVHTLR